MGLPAHLLIYFTKAMEQLPHGLVCIAENHKRTSGRMIVLELLQSGAVSNFFIEFHPGGGNDHGLDVLNGEFYGYAKYFRLSHGLVAPRDGKTPKPREELRARTLANAGNIERLFDATPELSTDAKPRLKSLAYIGLQRGVRVFAADPLIKRGVDDLPGRNAATAEMVHAKLNGGTGERSLLLWGASHVAPSRGSRSLDHCLTHGAGQEWAAVGGNHRPAGARTIALGLTDQQ